jgi:hypothetical protein
MGKMQYALARLLSGAGTVSDKTLRFPIGDDIAGSGFKSEVAHVYRTLGGLLPSVPLNLRSWDMEFDGIAVELDECLHFNRYRGTTLMSAIYADLPHFPLLTYRHYCSEHEESCIRAGSYGGKWSNMSSVAQFGVASPQKDLTGNGSPRWKQRAFYDFIKDLSPLLIGVFVVRIAVWDTAVDGGRTRTVEDILATPSQARSLSEYSIVND